jgi:hypothetical protein
MRAALLASLLAVAALAGCGGDADDSAADDYRARLDAACQRMADAAARLPQRVRDERLTGAEASALARREGDAFRRSVEALDPPQELRAGHGRLVELLDSEPEQDTVEGIRSWLLDGADAFGAVGAEDCERRQRATAESLRETAG